VRTPEETEASEEEGVVVEEHVVSSDLTVKLATPSDESPPPITKTIEKLLAERKAVRAMMKTEKDPQVYAILDARQKSRKVSCNSTYGLLGAKRGYLPMPDLAATITLEGRNALLFTEKVVKEEYGARIIAG
jgi:DNA polymerase elongation subunit (family B)